MLFLNVLTRFLSLASMVVGAQYLLPHGYKLMTGQIDWFGHNAGARSHVCIYDHAFLCLIPSHFSWLPIAMRTMPNLFPLPCETSALTLSPESWMPQLYWTSFSFLNMPVRSSESSSRMFCPPTPPSPLLFYFPG